MKFSLYRTPRRGAVLLLPLLAVACTDSTLLPPTPEATPADVLAALQCTVDVAAVAMTCTNVDPATGQGVAATRIFGSQDRNIKLTNVGGSFDGGTNIFEINVTVQNLTQQALGTTDGTTLAPNGIRVFFPNDPVVTGTGTVTIFNATGQAFITAPAQDYFQYDEVLQVNEISPSQPWQFQVTSSSTTFTFTVLIQAAQPNEALPLNGPTWQGTVSSDWATAGNWLNGVIPDSASSVMIPRASLLPGGASMPVLSANVQVTNLNVGAGSTLTLNANTLTAWGTVDALGTITGGTLWMRGTGTYLGGNLPSLVINGGTTLQRSSVASGAVSISDGSLVVDGSKPLSIAIP
ncbi:MAG TPA: hypothetical protein VF142_20300 [Longimicrobium sp.]